MNSVIKRWGNSLALRLPKDLVRTLGLNEGSKVEMRIEAGKLVIAPKRVRLNELLASLEAYGTSDPHGESDWGDNVGEERF